MNRWFQPVWGGLVWPILCVLTRWRCGDCGSSFRHYAPDTASYKRYLKSEIEKICRRYVEELKATYRSVVRCEGMLISHVGMVAEAESSESTKESESTPSLSHSTVHRWIGWMAESFAPNLWRCEEQAQSQSDEIDFGIFVIPSHKYRSELRRGVLECCRRVLRYLRLREKYPPDLGTGCRSP